MKWIIALLIGIIFSHSSLAYAQVEGPERARNYREVIKMGLYPPDLIMRHQQRLGITDKQRAGISESVKKFQTDVAGLQWTLQNDQQLLRQAMSGYRVEPEEALAQAKELMELESRFKLLHFELLIAIKNELTQDQIDMLRREIRQYKERNSQ